MILTNLSLSIFSREVTAPPANLEYAKLLCLFWGVGSFCSQAKSTIGIHFTTKRKYVSNSSKVFSGGKLN